MSDVASALAVLETVEHTLAEFRSNCQQWEAEFEALLGQFEAVDCNHDTPPKDDQAVPTDNGQLLQRQSQMEEDLTALRVLVEEQKKAISALADS